jgi:hypothetical protein
MGGSAWVTSFPGLELVRVETSFIRIPGAEKHIMWAFNGGCHA